MANLPQFTMRELLEAGVHFGHRAHRWNPRMQSYIFGVRNGIHVLDLRQTVPALFQSLAFIRQTVAGGGRVLFVGTKRQAQQVVADAASRSGQYYVNHRWLGGTLTNWKTISNSIKRLKEIEEMFAQQQKVNEKRAELQAQADAAKAKGQDDFDMPNISGPLDHLTKKERLLLQREHEKLDLVLGGIKNMGGLPDVVFVIDTRREDIAVEEANKLGIPVVGVVDSNCDPENIDYPIPGNDDASRAIKMYCRLVADSVLDGLNEQVSKAAAHQPAEQAAGGHRPRKTVVTLSPKAAKAAETPAEEAEDESKAKASAKEDETAKKEAGAGSEENALAASDNSSKKMDAKAANAAN